MSKKFSLTPSLFICTDDLHIRVHSKKLDDLFGFQINKCEAIISEDETEFNSWIGLEPEILQTPYSEIFQYFCALKDYRIEKIIDFGCAYGRVAIVSSAVFKDSHFFGYEVIKERANEGNRVLKKLGLKNSHIYYEDILEDSFKIEKADVYFIYDFSDPIQQKVILDKLSENVFDNKFFIIARGLGVRSLIQNKYPQFHSLYKPLHLDSASIYSSFTNLS